MLDRIVDLQQGLEGGPAPARAPVASRPTGEPDIVAAARGRGQFLGEAAAPAEPVEVAPPSLIIRLPESAALFVEPLQEQASFVENIVGQFVGQAVRLRVVAGAG